MKCWLWIFCKLCLLEELNNLINIDRAVTAFYSHVELTHSQKAKQWQCNHQHVEACTYTEWQQRLCAHVATNIQHSHSHCEDMIQLLRTYTSVRCSKSIDFSIFWSIYMRRKYINQSSFSSFSWVIIQQTWKLTLKWLTFIYIDQNSSSLLN